MFRIKNIYLVERWLCNFNFKFFFIFLSYVYATCVRERESESLNWNQVFKHIKKKYFQYLQFFFLKCLKISKSFDVGNFINKFYALKI